MPFCPKCGAIVSHGSVCPSCHTKVVIPAGFDESGGKDATIHDGWHKELSTGDKLLSSAFKSNNADVNQAINLMAGLGETCYICHQMIGGSSCQYNGKRHHPSCIRCFVCGKVCFESFNVQDGNFHCSECTSTAQLEQAAASAKTCSRCGMAISGSAIQVSVGCFHPSCFTCQECECCLDSSSGTALFTILPASGRIVCKSCFSRQASSNRTPSPTKPAGSSSSGNPPPPPRQSSSSSSSSSSSVVASSSSSTRTNIDGSMSSLSEVQDTKHRIDSGKEYCHACRLVISTTGVKAMGNWYHTSCLACHHCHQPLSSAGTGGAMEGYVVLNGQPHHVACAQEVSSASRDDDDDNKQTVVNVPSSNRTCAKCNEVLSGKCVTVKGQSFHSTCFTCSTCRGTIPGAYVMVSNQPVCEACARAAMAKESSSPVNKGIRVDPVTGQVYEGSLKKEWQRPPPNVR